jgi:hypothetical protein
LTKISIRGIVFFQPMGRLNINPRLSGVPRLWLSPKMTS